RFSNNAAPVPDTTANCKSQRAAALQAGERHGRLLRSRLSKSRIFQFTFPQVRGGCAGQIPQARNGLAAKSAGLLYSDVCFGAVTEPRAVATGWVRSRPD